MPEKNAEKSNEIRTIVRVEPITYCFDSPFFFGGIVVTDTLKRLRRQECKTCKK